MCVCVCVMWCGVVVGYIIAGEIYLFILKPHAHDRIYGRRSAVRSRASPARKVQAPFWHIHTCISPEHSSVCVCVWFVFGVQWLVCECVCARKSWPAAAPQRSGSARLRSPKMCDLAVTHADTHTHTYTYTETHACICAHMHDASASYKFNKIVPADVRGGALMLRCANAVAFSRAACARVYVCVCAAWCYGSDVCVCVRAKGLA